MISSTVFAVTSARERLTFMRIFASLLYMSFALQALFAAETPRRLSRELQEYLKRPEAQIRVLDGALLICKQAHRDLDLDEERKAFEDFAAPLKNALSTAISPRQQANAMAQFLFTDNHFGLPEKDDSDAFLLT